LNDASLAPPSGCAGNLNSFKSGHAIFHIAPGERNIEGRFTFPIRPTVRRDHFLVRCRTDSSRRFAGCPIRRLAMTVAKVTEITSSSTKSFEDAIKQGIARADKTLDNVRGAWIQEQTVVVEKGKITEYRVNMKVTFVLKS
jgi:flavin-binding protein dodecin